MLKISKEELAQRLAEKVPIAEDKTPRQALNTMIYGWLRFRKYGKKYCKAVANRDWLYIVEVIDLSDYVQVDLS